MTTGTKRRGRYLGAVALGVLVAAGLAGSANAQTATHGSATWSPSPSSGDWNTSSNWVPAAAPNGSADTATFDISTNTNVSLSQNTTVSGITFNATAVNGYTITAALGTTLTISGAGVVNNSGATQTLVTAGQDSTFTTVQGSRGAYYVTNASKYGILSFTGNSIANANGPVAIINSAGGSNGDAFGTSYQSGTTLFSNSSSAGSATITNNGNTSTTQAGGNTIFSGTATAGKATIINKSGDTYALSTDGSSTNFYNGHGSPSFTSFEGNSNAGTANITVQGSGGDDLTKTGAYLEFADQANAGGATITLTGNGKGISEFVDIGELGPSGVAEFFNSSSASNATLNINGGLVNFYDSSTAASATVSVVSGGLIFQGQADGGTSRVTLGSSAALDVSFIYSSYSGLVDPTYSPGSINIGSVAGSGFVRLGANALRVGGNNLSTNFSGSITTAGGVSDGIPYSNAAPFALIKVGTGALTLSGASTYTGATAVNAGTLSVAGSLVSAVTVNAGGTLTNSGTIGGLTLASGGTLASTGTPTTMTVTGAGSFANGSTVDLAITPSGASDLISIGGTASLGGATLDVLAASGTYAPGQSYTLLTANGGLTGTFAFGGITGGTYATQPTLGYTANSVLLNFAALAAPTHGSAVWSAQPVTGDWNTPANWANDTVPNGPADIATFDKTTIPTVSLSQNTQVDSIVFNPGAAANPYTITAAPGTTLTISGAGVVNNSGVGQNFVTGAASTGGGLVVFTGNAAVSSASPVTITNSGSNALGGLAAAYTTQAGTPLYTFGNGSTVFDGASSAGNAVIYNLPNTQTVGGSTGNGGTSLGAGATYFYGTSSAGGATIYNNVATPGPTTTADNFGGLTTFGENASAANATIYAYGNLVTRSDSQNGGVVDFFDNSSAANSIINVTGDGVGPDSNRREHLDPSGIAVFYDSSTAGSARFNVNGGEVDFFNHSTAAQANLIVTSGNAAFFDQSSGGTARVALGSSGTLDLSELNASSSYNAATGDISDTPATLTVGSLEGSGFVRLGANGLTVGGNNLSTNYAGSITNAGGVSSADTFIVYVGTAPVALTKIGTGTLTLSGASTYTGATAVNAGTLSVTGSLVSPVTVNSGAMLTVSGKVGGVTLAQGSTLTTLGTPQMMTVAGAASFATGSTVKLVVTPSASNDQIAVGGAAQLGGATLQIAASPGAYGTQRYTLLSAAGGVNGTFAFSGVTGLGTLSALVSPSLVYSPTSVVLAFQRVQIGGGTFNERAVAGALNADALTAPFLTALTANGLPSNAQLDQASGEIHATLRSALLDDGALLREATFDRLLGATVASVRRQGLTPWVDVRGARTTLDSDGNAARAHAAGQAIVIGADYGLGQWRIGAAYSNNWGRVTVADRGSSAKWNADSVEAYAGGAIGPVALRGGASETWYRLDTHRSPDLASAGSDTAQYHARLDQVFGEAAIGAGLGVLHGEAFGRWTGERLTTDGFAETGGATALSGTHHRNDLGWSLAGLRGAVPLGGTVSFNLSAGWTHLFGDATPSANLSESTGTGFEVLGAPLARDAARVAAALSARVGEQVTLRLGYTGEYARGNTQHALNAAAVMRF